MSGKRTTEEEHPYIAEQLRPLAIDIESVNKDPANARKHSQRNLEAIRASLQQFGQRQPIVVQRNGMICRAGNGRLEAAKALGWKKIAAVLVDESASSAVQFAIADNRTAELAEWDTEVLTSLLRTLSEEEMVVTGFTGDELQSLLGSLETIETKADALQTSAEEYAASVVRQIVLVFSESEYQRVIDALAKYADQHGLTNNTEVVMHLLETNGYAVSARDTEEPDA